MRKIIVLIGMLLVAWCGQQLYGQVYDLRSYLYPASAGQNQQAIAFYQEQFAGLGQTRQSSLIIGFDKEYRKDFASGLFVKTLNNHYWNEYEAMVPITAKLLLGQTTLMSLSLIPEIQGFQFENVDPTRQIYDDPTFLNASREQVLLNMGVGLSVKIADKFHVDLAGKKLASLALKNDDIFEQVPHLLGAIGYKYKATSMITLHPMIHGVTMFEPMLYQIQPGFRIWYGQFLWTEYDLVIGNGVENNIGHNISFGARALERMMIGVGYITGNQIMYTNSQGTFNLYVTYDLKITKGNKPGNT